ncbi:hypothetical protein Pst134EA_031379 [Puccinia striiformis f. sp. tritici]|uniref:uncharacterized protein n=1 Tax=Puccinia striiformis f. sp. tritici TaxID=168172 RepID=UPI0020083739|nr:uncharacterized protein Pst134EA_031379 [Puccinia striiformis f. sp. tritici]KAH9445321.1 hypothetical protein Pst134EA_031379 [Puccinia striiformis f. sp. tritici]
MTFWGEGRVEKTVRMQWNDLLTNPIFSCCYLVILAPLQHGGFDCNGARLDSFNGEEDGDGLETPGPKCCLPSLKPKKNENMAFEINAIDLPTDCTGPSSL